MPMSIKARLASLTNISHPKPARAIELSKRSHFTLIHITAVSEAEQSSFKARIAGLPHRFACRDDDSVKGHHAQSLLFSLLLAACSTQPTALQSASAKRDDNCKVDKICALTGQLGIELAAGNYSTAYINLNERPCVPLLLSEAMFRKYRRLDGKTVNVTGEALAKAPTASDVINIQYRDRWLQTGFCGQSAIVVYADALTTAKP
jgi:hypothetical protein